MSAQPPESASSNRWRQSAETHNPQQAGTNKTKAALAAAAKNAKNFDRNVLEAVGRAKLSKRDLARLAHHQLAATADPRREQTADRSAYALNQLAQQAMENQPMRRGLFVGMRNAVSEMRAVRRGRKRLKGGLSIAAHNARRQDANVRRAYGESAFTPTDVANMVNNQIFDTFQPDALGGSYYSPATGQQQGYIGQQEGPIDRQQHAHAQQQAAPAQGSQGQQQGFGGALKEELRRAAPAIFELIQMANQLLVQQQQLMAELQNQLAQATGVQVTGQQVTGPQVTGAEPEAYSEAFANMDEAFNAYQQQGAGQDREVVNEAYAAGYAHAVRDGVDLDQRTEALQALQQQLATQLAELQDREARLGEQGPAVDARTGEQPAVQQDAAQQAETRGGPEPVAAENATETWNAVGNDAERPPEVLTPQPEQAAETNAQAQAAPAAAAQAQPAEAAQAQPGEAAQVQPAVTNEPASPTVDTDNAAANAQAPSQQAPAREPVRQPVFQSAGDVKRNAQGEAIPTKDQQRTAKEDSVSAMDKATAGQPPLKTVDPKLATQAASASAAGTQRGPQTAAAKTNNQPNRES
ncbi:hypothetical protein AB0E69_21715 [Kribbella sp. NPDC026611]|uniref:hypothetical protein n=1 Tax=Kribbella sp. NPDC026611 TaxID=3154911 RepID=UPI0033ECEC7A